MTRAQVTAMDLSPSHKWRTEIPNIVWREGWLSALELAAYTVVKGIAGDMGECFYSYEKLARMMGMSVHSVGRCLRSLQQKELIHLSTVPIPGGGARKSVRIEIKDLWVANHEYHISRMPERHPADAREADKEEPNKKNPVGTSPAARGFEDRKEAVAMDEHSFFEYRRRLQDREKKSAGVLKQCVEEATGRPAHFGRCQKLLGFYGGNRASDLDRSQLMDDLWSLLRRGESDPVGMLIGRHTAKQKEVA